MSERMKLSDLGGTPTYKFEKVGDRCRGPVVAHWPAGDFAGPCDVLVASADDCSAAELADPFAAGLAQVGERLKWMVVTQGPGEVVAYDGAQAVRVTPPETKVVDATGAGDVFAAGLLEVRSWEMLAGLLSHITVAKALNRQRDLRRQRRDAGREVGLADWQGLEPGPGPEHIAMFDELLQKAFAALDDEERRMVELHLDGYSAEVIGEKCNFSSRTVQRAVRRFGKKLEELLDQEEPS